MSVRSLPWHRRLEARVVASVTLLVAVSLGAILVATTRAVTGRSLERMSTDLNAARMGFQRLASERARFASRQSALITGLPVFRAHLSDSRIAQDVATLEAMAEHYRQQLDAAFAIVGDRTGEWIAAAGRSRHDRGSTPLTNIIETATAGSPARGVISTGGAFYLVVSEPAAFADEMLGTLTVGYALDDEFAASLAQVTHREVNLVDGRRVYASSLDGDERTILSAAIFEGAWPLQPGAAALQDVGGSRYVVGAFPLSLAGTAPASGRLVLLSDWGPTQAFLTSLQTRLLITGALIFVVALGSGVLFSRRVTKPLEDLANAARDISEGNWKRQLPVGGTIEETMMAQAVNSITTNLRHWYEEAKVRDDRLRQAQKQDALGRLAGGVAHDFNNVLTAIRGYGELLMESLDEGDHRYGKAQEILKAADTAAGLTRQLLAFSRQRVSATCAISLARLLAGAEKMLRRVITEDIELRTKVAPTLGCVRADPCQLEQVLLNLVVNARDAMPRGGSIDIELAEVVLAGGERVHLPPGTYVCLTVRDTGCGMTPDVQARVFEPFFTTKREGAGTGLGLAVVYGIVEQLGGAIALESEVGRGTTFYVYLPPTAEREEMPEVELPAPAAGSETVLLVEDELQVANLVAAALQRNGYTILRAGNGDEALEIARMHRAPIHLLLTDVVMPGMNGRELAERVTAMRPETRVLYMSGYAGEAVVRRGVEAAAQFIPKPFSISALTSKIREILSPDAFPMDGPSLAEGR